MTPEQINLVKTTWAQVVPISEQAAELFYGRLFEINPAYSDLFKGDMKAQGKKLMSMINTAVNSLDNLEAVVPAVQALGQRHVAYGVKDEDYDAVAAALLWTLGQGLGEGFTPEVEEAWTTTYTTLATVMIEASHQAA
ncbi:hemin receptor [Mangrovimicrobium sediminis]|uniref:Hemin receptor n=1 Tax=Mangrovimicrobium sediminis TaxID=2562682 RepID=A0A4Z0LX15_9GAMM|nr:globin family protein [Haliea sp. SAOS-164]TGD71764.1 hemin receptor [Haliea sp. SAOS-164]